MSDPKILQAALTQIQTDIGVIHAEIEQWAGKSNKPPQVTRKINSIIQAVDPPFNVVFTHNPLNSNAQPALAGWVEFKKVWNHGDGSWTQCRQITQTLAGWARMYRL
jgi:hypothetical protein